jgi:hypothetical protein
MCAWKIVEEMGLKEIYYQAQRWMELAQDHVLVVRALVLVVSGSTTTVSASCEFKRIVTVKNPNMQPKLRFEPAIVLVEAKSSVI